MLPIVPSCPPYPKILHPHIEIEIILGPPVPLPSLRGLNPINVILPIVLVPLGFLPYPEDIGGVPVYLGLGGCKGGPIFPRLVLVPLQLLTNLLDDPSNGLDSGVEFYLPLLYHNCICIIYLYY